MSYTFTIQAVSLDIQESDSDEAREYTTCDSRDIPQGAGEVSSKVGDVTLSMNRTQPGGSLLIRYLSLREIISGFEAGLGS